MCEHGDTVTLNVLVPADLAFEGVDTWKDKPVDRCLAPLVQALNHAGILTRASCCGHGKRPGNIALADGRELVVVATFEEARRLDAFIGVDIHGRRTHHQVQTPCLLPEPRLPSQRAYGGAV